MDQRFLIACLGFVFFFFSITQVFSGQKLLENWDTAPALDAAWGGSNVQDQDIYVSGGTLHHVIRPYSTLVAGNNLTTYSAFPYSTATSLIAFQSKIRIESIGDISSAPVTKFAAAEFGGVFYNSNTTPTNSVGDISFFAHFGDRGNGLEAWYVLVRNDAPDSSSFTELASGVFTPPDGGWQTGTDYILAVAYDGSKSFTATLGGQPTDIHPLVGPDKGSAAWWAGKAIITNVGLNEPFVGDPDAYAIHAVYDDVQIDTGSGLTPHDNFSSADESLSTLLWDSSTLVRQSTVTNGMLKVRLKVASGDTVVGYGFRHTIDLPSEHQATDFLQADMKIEGNTMQTAARARVAIGGYFGNGKYTAAGNGTDGAISFNANVEKRQESDEYRVLCNAAMVDENLDPEVEIMWEHVPALADTWYTATLSKTGSTLHCQIAETSTGAVVLSTSTDVTTVGISSIASVGETRELFLRNVFAPAEVIGYFDNVYVKEGKGGDINQDDAVNLTDDILALQIVAGLNPPIPRLTFGTDVDGDNKIGLAEAIYGLQAAALLIDTTPPAIVAGPALSETTANGTTLSVTINENGTGHYLIQAASAPAPTSAWVASRPGITMIANVPATVNISGLTVSTDYTVYFVAKDSAGNTQSSSQQAGFTSLGRPDWLPGNFFSLDRPIVCKRGESQGYANCSITCRQYHDNERTLIWKTWSRGVAKNQPSMVNYPYYQRNDYQITDENGSIEKTYAALAYRERKPGDSPVSFPGGSYDEYIGNQREVTGMTSLHIGYEPDWGCTAGSSYLMVLRGTTPTYTYDPPGYASPELNCGSFYACNSPSCYDLPQVTFDKFVIFAMGEGGPTHTTQYTLDDCSNLGCSNDCMVQENHDTVVY